MSGIMSVAAAVSAAASVASFAYNAATAGDAQKQQQDAAAAAAKAAGTAQNATAANTGAPGVGTPVASGVNSGPASTLLTGAGGVNNSSLNLGALSGIGANTLLGQ